MRSPSSQKCRLDLAPPLADRFILGVTPSSWDRAPTRRLQAEGYRTCSFDCKASSQFRHGYVFGGPPIMPYGRISQVRFEVLVMRRPWAFPAWRGLSADSQYAPTSMVCPGCSSISYVGSLSALCPTAPLNDGTTKYPESLCPVSALPPLGRRGPSPRRALPLPHRSYGLIRRSRHLSSTSALASLEESLQVVISPCR
jgi:hypothetical protein